jgi:hypothetical protein
VLANGDIHSVFLSATGFACAALSLPALWKAARAPTLLWDEDRGILAMLRPWRVEVIAARVVGSIPIGIDLSFSANRVLSSMHARYRSERGTELRFFICRPVGQGSTRVGMMVVRKRLRILNFPGGLSSLSDELTIDARVLESAMRAAYPHMPLEPARLDDLLMVNGGGVEAIVHVE